MEEIPIPTRRARDKRPVHLEVQPQAFGGQRFAIRLDWNSVAEQWVIEIEHLPREFIVTRSVANAYRPYSYMPFLVFMFADPSAEAEQVTPDTIGDPMKLWVLPGPAGQQPGGE